MLVGVNNIVTSTKNLIYDEHFKLPCGIRSCADSNIISRRYSINEIPCIYFVIVMLLIVVCSAVFLTFFDILVFVATYGQAAL